MRILLIAYDNNSYIHWFPQGLAYIAAILLKAGYEVEVYSQDKFHYPQEHLTQYLDTKKFDLVGVGVIAGYFQYRKLLKISDAIDKSRKRPFFVIGGHGPSPEPEFFLRKTLADAVVISEGEVTILELADAIANKRSLSRIKGIAFRQGDKVTINQSRALITDIDTLPFPAYSIFPIDYYRLLRMPHATNRDFVIPVLSGRGCNFKCNFCYRMEEGFRSRSNKSIVEEIKLLKKDYGITYIAFSDELLMSSPARTVSLCEEIIQAKLGIKWYCQGRLNYAKPQILQLMKRAGCVFINYGIEAMDDEVLEKMNKCLTTRQIIAGVEATKKAAISPGLNIIFGNIGDTRETLRKGVEFLLKYEDGVQLRTIRPVTPYPGSPLYYYAIKKKLLKDAEDFYERKHINSDLISINFTDLCDKEFHQALMEANKMLISNYYRIQLSRMLKQNRKLYMKKDASFRGFRQT